MDVNSATQNLIDYHHTTGHSIRNTYGNVTVSIPVELIPNKHGYGHTQEHPSTNRASALSYLREVLGPEWVILARIEVRYMATPQPGHYARYSAVRMAANTHTPVTAN